MRSPAWLVLLLGVPALAVSALDVTACTSFSGEPEDAGVATDGSVTPGSDAAGPDALPPDSAMPATCPGGVMPLTFLPKAAEAELPHTVTPMGSLNVVDGVNGPSISASGQPPQSTDGGLRAFATWKRRGLALAAGTGTLEYDLDLDYAGDKVFTQSGCALELNGAGGEASVKLRFASNGAISFEGRESDGRNEGTYGPVPFTLSSPPTNPIRSFVRVRLALGQTRVGVTVEFLGATASRDIKAPTPIQVVTLKCGIDYADNSDGEVLTAKIGRVMFSFCPALP